MLKPPHPVIVKTFSLQHINENDELFNVNNLYDKQPDDYWVVSKLAQTDKWIDQFHGGELKKYHTIKLVTSYRNIVLYFRKH